MSDADCTPGREPRSVAASYDSTNPRPANSNPKPDPTNPTVILTLTFGVVGQYQLLNVSRRPVGDFLSWCLCCAWSFLHCFDATGQVTGTASTPAYKNLFQLSRKALFQNGWRKTISQSAS